MKRILLLLMVIAAAGNACYARLYGQQKADSMREELARQKEDTNKVKLLCSLCYELAPLNPADGVKYGIDGMALAQKLNWKKGIGLANFSLGIGYKAKAELPKALEYLLEAAKINTELGYKPGVMKAWGNIGLLYRSIGDTTKSLEYFGKAIAFANELRDTMAIATYNGNVGNLYCDEIQNFQKALEYMHAALQLFEIIGDAPGISRNTYNIGNVYGYIGDYTTAAMFFTRSLKLGREMGDKIRIMDNLGAMGNVYLQLATGSGAKPQIGGVNGDFLKELPDGKYIPAKDMPKGSNALMRAALENFRKALELAKQTQDIYAEMNFHKQLAQAYRASRDFENAYGAETEANRLKDSIFSLENRDQIMKLDMKYEYERIRFADSLKAAQKEGAIAAHLQRQRVYTIMGIAGVLALAVFSFFIMKERKLSEMERKKSDELLLNILPAEVADELKATGLTTAKHYDNVTVLFTDFVNFTKAAEQLSPQGLIDELHACFKAFDEITAKYNIEKIKTIGDAYLAVCGLPTADPKHAEYVVRAATEINAFMQDRLSKMGSERTFSIRIGIHSGSVVAGIVGVKKFAYDIWGDTVNTAARMEQHGEAGKINISQTTYELVKDKFSCEYRGEVDVKGKGVMRMYFVG